MEHYEYNLNITSIDFEKREITGRFCVKIKKVNSSLSGYNEIAELDVSGTYPFSMDSDGDGFDFKIEYFDYEYRFSFNQYGLEKAWANYIG